MTDIGDQLIKFR